MSSSKAWLVAGLLLWAGPMLAPTLGAEEPATAEAKAPDAAQGPQWIDVDPDAFPIVSQFAVLSEPPKAFGDRNKLGGQSIHVQFRYEGAASARVVYNEFPKKVAEPSIDLAAKYALQTYPLFKDGSFALGETGTADSPLGPFTYQVMYARQSVDNGPLLSCAVFQRLISAGMAAVSGYFCEDATAFSLQRVNAFFQTLGIRGIGMPEE